MTAFKATMGILAYDGFESYHNYDKKLYFRENFLFKITSLPRKLLF